MKIQAMAAALIAASMTAVAPASADAALITGFTGPFGPATFNQQITGGVPNGSITFTPTTLVLTGQDDPSIDPGAGVPACPGAITGFLGNCQVIASHSVLGASDTVSFNWAYTTNDISAGYDIFGVLADGAVTVLSDPGGPLSQSGSFSFTSAQSFAFFVNCTDCVGGAATADVTGFQVAVVPEPASTALFGIGAVGAIYAGRRRRRAGTSLLA